MHFIIALHEVTKKEKYLKNVKMSRDLPCLRKLNRGCVSSEAIVNVLESERSLEERIHKKLKIYFLRKYTDKTLQEISDRIANKKLSVSGISRILSWVERGRREDKKLDGMIKRIEDKILNV